MRRIRSLLKERMDEGLELVRTAFPANTHVSLPTGGYMCWLRVAKNVSTTQLLLSPQLGQAMFLPGEMFSVSAGFSNYMALNFSQEWTPARRKAIAELGKLVEQAIGTSRAVSIAVSR